MTIKATCNAALLLIAAGFTPSVFAVECRVVERIGNHFKDHILTDIRGLAVGEYEVSPRKNLIVHSVDDIRFTGCRAVVKATIEVERKVRRDAKGNARIAGDIDPDSVKLVDPSVGKWEFCFTKEPRIEKMKLSNTAGIGERQYKKIANRVWPRERCYTFIVPKDEERPR
ncbi:hypothetical protein [Halothiobacillus neapolitanus]|uniref:Uncharacterized protein n=1 Tax=Halothiobacillus neapolitanus (strain ATCC 23641 / DSM 15147 / CIP 104769 / NCIMB 8539 / c2) TaxID=555778 RepID=D0KWJ6_HALNC|nr:hypothetical protein [Halothiobacillus neapolitanus]ACX94993.1 hypothetical protein Hneap_0129 [Halothiobacillus neapolitanus c2]TDN61055.1 hypothetical protein C8D83_103187 [Halothiobacillus neapolitanus]